MPTRSSSWADGPLATAVDNLLSGLLTVKFRDSVRGLGRHDRTQRLLAAHAVLVVTAFCDALDEFVHRESVDPLRLSRDEQLRLVAAPAGQDRLPRSRLLVRPRPLPGP